MKHAAHQMMKPFSKLSSSTKNYIKQLETSLERTTSRDALELIVQLMCFDMNDTYENLHVELNVGSYLSHL
jgi:hypothetical protein